MLNHFHDRIKLAVFKNHLFLNDLITVLHNKTSEVGNIRLRLQNQAQVGVLQKDSPLQNAGDDLPAHARDDDVG